MLEDWAEELDEDRITERYGVGPGDIRGKVDTAEWLLGAAEQLAAELDIDGAVAIRKARKRVADGIKEELLELAGVRGVGRVRARRLFEAGVETRADLRDADKDIILGASAGRRQLSESWKTPADGTPHSTMSKRTQERLRPQQPPQGAATGRVMARQISVISSEDRRRVR